MNFSLSRNGGKPLNVTGRYQNAPPPSYNKATTRAPSTWPIGGMMPPASSIVGSGAGLTGSNGGLERGYFDDDDDAEDEPPAAARQARHGSEDEEDPLDQFMADVGNTVKKQEAEAAAGGNKPAVLPEIVSGQERDYEAYYDFMEQQAKAEAAAEVEYDSDGIPVGLRGAGEKKSIEPLPPVDHTSVKYTPFRRDFYRAHGEISALSDQEANAVRTSAEIHVMGSEVPRAIQTFQQAGFDARLLREIARCGYETPTAIQMQALPVVLSGRDLIGLAKTGSGKTLSFVWPMIVHVLDQPQMKAGDGPIGLILAPTRELAAQIYSEATKFCKIYNIRVCAIFGGEGKWEMAKALKEAPEIVVATPGRFIDLAKTDATNLRRCTMVVLDEADRMFDMGFEYQMRSIVNNIRPDRQTLLFSATMKKKIEGFAREILRDPVRIVVGSIGESNKDIRQVVDVLSAASGKWPWLTSQIDDWVAEGKVLIFVGSKLDTETLTSSLQSFFTHRQLAVGVDCLHGDKSQTDRANILRKFRSGELAVLVATDVASRGLDIKDIRTVVNYDAAKNIETHVHRIGRTGRMGVDGVVPGTAFTVLVAGGDQSSDSSLAVDLVKNLRDADQESAVSAALLRLAETDPRWAKVKSLNKGARGPIAPGDRGGIGSAAAPVAMTSAMLATGGSSREKHGVAQNFKANPYVEGHGMGRGKHLTQPSWMEASDTAKSTIDGIKTSRFTEAKDGERNPVTYGLQHQSRDIVQSNAPVLSGFVRSSSQILTSVTVQVRPEATNPELNHPELTAPPRKKSRWDT